MKKLTTYIDSTPDSMPSAVVEIEIESYATAIVVFVHRSSLGTTIVDGQKRSIRTGDRFELDRWLAKEDPSEALRRCFGQDTARWREVNEWWNGTRNVKARQIPSGT